MVYTGHRTCRDITSVCVCAFKVRVLMGTMVTLDMQQKNVRTNTHTHSLTTHTHTHSLTLPRQHSASPCGGPKGKREGSSSVMLDEHNTIMDLLDPQTPL